MRKLNFILAFGILAALFLAASCGKSQESSGLDAFSKCLTEKGVKFYGAFWCPHCTSQKNMFGPSLEHVNYIECSLPDKSQTKACSDAGIQAYPTWEFSDGSRVEGALSLTELSQRSGCELE